MRKAISTIASAALLACLAAPKPLAADDTPARRAYAAGVEELQKHHWGDAAKDFRQATLLKPDYAEAYDKLGQSLFNQGKVMEAITEFKHATAIDPRSTEAWYDLGYGFENEHTDSLLSDDGAAHWYHLGFGGKDDTQLKDNEKARKKLLKTEVSDAESAYRGALAVDPPNDIRAEANAHFRLGVLLRDEAVHAAEAEGVAGNTLDAGKSNLKEAMGHLEAANRLIPDFPEARNELGRLYDMIARYPEAIGQYDLAIKGHKYYAEAYSNRGVAWWKEGNWDKALEDTRKAIEIDPKFAGGHYNFAEVVFARVEELRQGGKGGDRSVIHLEAQKAVDEYRVATELDPDMMPAWYGLAKAYHGYHDFPNAEKTYQAILEKDKKEKKAKQLLKDLQKEEKAYEAHIPKQYREEVEKEGY